MCKSAYFGVAIQNSWWWLWCGLVCWLKLLLWNSVFVYICKHHFFLKQKNYVAINIFFCAVGKIFIAELELDLISKMHWKQHQSFLQQPHSSHFGSNLNLTGKTTTTPAWLVNPTSLLEELLLHNKCWKMRFALEILKCVASVQQNKKL